MKDHLRYFISTQSNPILIVLTYLPRVPFLTGIAVHGSSLNWEISITYIIVKCFQGRNNIYTSFGNLEKSRGARILHS